MILYPAIDLKQGQCVRLEQGDMNRATVFNANPIKQALQFVEQGFEWLHIVDLDGAFAGKSINGERVDEIVKAIDIPVQLGGGIRSLQAIENWLKKGVTRIIIGTAALRDPDLVKTACKTFPNHIAVGIDAKDGYVAVEGWAEVSDITAEECARRFADAGVTTIIHTDIARDGLGKGLNFKASRKLAANTPIPIIASGGLGSIKDIETLLQPENKILGGAIAGKALYSGTLNSAEALNLIKQKRAA